MEIKIEGVVKQFPPDILALRNITITIPQGDFVYLVGPTGSGKTTLMRLITREVVPTKGRVLVGGTDLRKLGMTDLAYYRREIGVVFQDFRLLPHLTAYENLTFVQEAIGMPRDLIEERTNEILDKMGLWRRRFLYPEQLSGGEQQRLAIARATINCPSILLADEPTGNLDLQTAEDIMKILLSINATGTTLVVATHNQYIVDEFRQRVISLKGGRIIRDERKGRFEIDDDF